MKRNWNRYFPWGEFIPIFEGNYKICYLNLVQSFLIARTAFNNALNENIGNRFKRRCVPFGFHPYFCKGSNHDAARFEAAGLSPTPLFSSSPFPSATTSPLNSWHSQVAIDNPWYFIRKHFNFLSFSAVSASDAPALKMRKYEKLTEKENWEIIHSDSSVEIYSTPRKIFHGSWQSNLMSRRMFLHIWDL